MAEASKLCFVLAEASKLKLFNNIERIIGAISLGRDLNPPNNRLSSPCSICNRNCLETQDSVECNACWKYCHRTCDGMSLEEHMYYQKSGDEVKWYCMDCTVRFHHTNIPFISCGLSELININNSDTMEFCNYVPALEVVCEASSFSKYSQPDPGLDLPNLVNSKYHSVSEFQDLGIEKNF